MHCLYNHSFLLWYSKLFVFLVANELKEVANDIIFGNSFKGMIRTINLNIKFYFLESMWTEGHCEWNYVNIFGHECLKCSNFFKLLKRHLLPSTLSFIVN